MKIRHLLLGITTGLAATVGLVSPAHATPGTSLDVTCSPFEGGTIVVSTDDSTGTWNIEVDLEDEFGVPSGNYSFGPFANGSYEVRVRWSPENSVDVYTVFDGLFTVSCPEVEFSVACEDDGAHILVDIADEAKDTYDVYVDDLDNPINDEAIGDTAGTALDLGVFEPGQHSVAVYWLGSDSESFYYLDSKFVVDCSKADAGSGAGIPPTGSTTTPMMMLAGAFLLLGGGLVLGRRLRRA